MPSEDVTKAVRPLTSVELLDAAVVAGDWDSRPATACRVYRCSLAPSRPLALSAFADTGDGCHYFNVQGERLHRKGRRGTIECWVGLGDVRQSTGYLREESNANGLA